MKQMTFVMAMKDFFGFHPGQTLSQFMEEIRALTQEDRQHFTDLLPSVGYQIVERR